jgi:hypothetical protein
MKKILILLTITSICGILTGCDDQHEYGTVKSITNNIDYNLAIQNQKIDDLNSKLDQLNTTLSNIDKNIVIVSNRNLNK